MECSINSPALSLLMKHLVIGQRLKTHNFSSRLFIGHHAVVSANFPPIDEQIASATLTLIEKFTSLSYVFDKRKRRNTA